MEEVNLKVKTRNLGKLDQNLNFELQNIVLILHGAFYPPHKNHLKTLEVTKQYFHNNFKSQFNILGAFLVPSHNQSLKKKMGSFQTDLLETENRIFMTQQSIIDHEWISGDYWLMRQPKNVGVTSAKAELEKKVNEYYENKYQDQKFEKIQVFSVLGMDKLKSCAKFSLKSVQLFVQNRSGMNKDDGIEEDSTQQFINDFKQQNLSKIGIIEKNLIIIKDTSVKIEMSSTLVRQMVNNKEFEQLKDFLSQKVLQYIIDENVQFKTINSNNNNTNIQNPQQQEQHKNSENQNQILEQQNIVFSELIDVDCPQIDFKTQLFHKNKDKQEFLGSGVSGRVYKMDFIQEHKGINEKVIKELISQEVAVKMMQIPTQRLNRFLETFKRELKISLAISSKNDSIIKCYGAGKYDQYLFIVFELAQFASFSDTISILKKQIWFNSQMPPSWFKSLADLAHGIYLVHQNGIVHRDIILPNLVLDIDDNELNKQCSLKSEKQQENYQITEDTINNTTEIQKDEEIEQKQQKFQNLQKLSANCRIKLIDFGLAAFLENVNLRRGSTKHYSPESQQDKSVYTIKSDSYMFGNLLYEFIHGHQIFPDSSVKDTYTLLQLGHRPEWDMQSDFRLKNLCKMCWQQDPEKRPDFKQIQEILLDLYQKQK